MFFRKLIVYHVKKNILMDVIILINIMPSILGIRKGVSFCFFGTLFSYKIKVHFDHS